MEKVCKLYFNACLEYHLEPIDVGYINGFTFKMGNKIFNFTGTHTPLNDTASFSIASNKFSTNKVLSDAGITVPKASGITKVAYENNLLDISELRFPLVVKPTWDTSCGVDVTCNIKNSKVLQEVIKDVFQRQECLSFEEYEPGLRSYRVLVLYNKVIGIVERIPAHVIGDGQHAIKQLIDIENEKRDKLKEILPLGKMRIMKETEIIFDELGINADYVPKVDENIPIRYICNSTWGGTFVGLALEKICKENADLACRAAKALNLNLVGLDFICTDISIPYNQSRGFIIEANASPDISIHENTVNGVPTRVSLAIIKKIIQKNFFSYLYFRISRKYVALILRFFVVVLSLFVVYQYFLAK